MFAIQGTQGHFATNANRATLETTASTSRVLHHAVTAGAAGQILVPVTMGGQVLLAMFDILSIYKSLSTSFRHLCALRPVKTVASAHPILVILTHAHVPRTPVALIALLRFATYSVLFTVGHVAQMVFATARQAGLVQIVKFV